jgi:hypothetical protein
MDLACGEFHPYVPLFVMLTRPLSDLGTAGFLIFT